MNRDEYRSRAVEVSARGEDLPQAILTTDQVREIRQAAWKRKEIRDYIRDNLSDAAMCKKHGISSRRLWDWKDAIPEVRQARIDRANLLSFVTENLTNQALARKYKTHPNNIFKIINRMGWVHVDSEGRVVPRKPSLEALQGFRRRAS